MSDTVEIVLIYGPDGSLQAGIPGGVSFEQAARPSGSSWRTWG